MAECKNNCIVTEGGSLGSNAETSQAITEAVGINTQKSVSSYGEQTVAMDGDWNWKENVGGNISKYDNIIKASAKRLNLDWRLCAALCYVESGFNPNAYNSSGATGLWQILKKYWKSYAPPGCNDASFLKDPEKSTLGFEKVMKQHLERNSKAETRNDQIALAIQCYHDGSLGGPSPRWCDREPGQCGKTTESYQYVPKIIRKYKEYCT